MQNVFSKQVKILHELWDYEQEKQTQITSMLDSYEKLVVGHQGLTGKDLINLSKLIKDADLQKRFYQSFPLIKTYQQSIEEQEKIAELTLFFFGAKNCPHIFISEGKHAVCLLCHISSANYNITLRDEDFLWHAIHTCQRSLADYANQQVFTLAEKEEWLHKMALEESKIKESASENRSIDLEKCLIRRYEIKILAGENLGKLYQGSHDSEVMLKAFSTALEHLQDEKFRMHCGYFESDQEALEYRLLKTKCQT